ncbi:OmpA family protein [Marinilongibacter aquaticus]|uniref:OmpA family protein n=1 Tax=Marinilongibacter aquaticus TaxID=2975157 RepID=UPI0021BD1CF7|nr:OmpA family protein [Marinilongibacter aquaticus]UBM59409.1 OmpA family protein [Marinilongibacter aquaticus]
MVSFSSQSLRFLLLFAIPFLGFILSSEAQTTVILEARDDYNGKGLDVEFRVESVATKHSYTIKVDDGIKYIEMPKKEDIVIKAILDGYYVEDKTLLADDINSDSYVFRMAMQKRPTAKLIVKAISGSNKKDEPASFDVFYQGRMIGRGKTTKSIKTYEFVVNEQGTYQIVVNAQGFDEKVEMVDVQVGVPMKIVERNIPIQEPAKAVEIRIVDALTGAPIDASVGISASEESADLQSKNGKTEYAFEEGKTYIIEAKAAGYADLKNSIFGSQKEALTLKMQPQTYLHFEVVDEESKKPITDAHVAVAMQSRKQEELDGYDYFPPKNGIYYAIVSAKGYFQKSDTIYLDNTFNGRVVHQVLMAKERIPYAVTLVDHYSKEVISGADFRVFANQRQGASKSTDLGIKTYEDRGEYLFSVLPAKEHFIEASKVSYSDLTKMLDENQLKFTVEMFWSPEYTYTIQLFDRAQNKVVQNGKLTINDQTGKALFVYEDKENNQFKIKKFKEQTLTYRVNAAGYRSEVLDVETDSYRNIKLFLERSDSREIVFQAEDFLTGEKINPTIKYFVDNKEISLQSEGAFGPYKGKINGVGNYKVTANQMNYNALSQNLELASLGANPYILRLKKNFYTVKIYVENFKSAIDRDGLEVRVNTESNNQVPERFNKQNEAYETDLKLDTKYTVQIGKAGFEPYYRTFELQDLIQDNLEIHASLKEKPKPVAVVPKPEPVKEDLPIVAEEKAPEPLKVEEVVHYEEEAEAMPEADKLTEELNKKESIGKRYLLDEVYFDQSSAVIRDNEVPQLNELAQTLKSNPNMRIAIVGYTDNVGDLRRNLGLSKFRAKAVANYLFYKGAQPEHIESDGMGQEHPVAPNDSEENKAKNRRVEMVLIEN